MTKLPPLVTIGLPVYQNPQRVERALSSLVNQTYKNIEIIVCDDASADQTPEICKKFSKQYRCIQVEINQANLGAHYNFRKTLSMAKGKYFMWGDQDDYWAPSLIETLVSILETDSSIIAVMSAGRVVWPNGAIFNENTLSRVNKPQNKGYLANAILVVAKRHNKTKILKNNMFIHGLIHTKAFSSAIKSYPGVFQHERQIVCQLALAGRLYFVDEFLYERTRHVRRLEERRPHNDATILVKSKPFSKFRYMFGLSVSIIRSPIIPSFRKLYFPLILFAYFWTTVVVKYFIWSLSKIAHILPLPVYSKMKNQWSKLS